MPLIRYTYPSDVRQYGSEPVEVPDVSARVLVADRRAVLVVPHEELAEQTKAELARRAAEVGADVSPRAAKAAIVEAIEKAQAE